jgi:hypothetical protein
MSGLRNNHLSLVLRKWDYARREIAKACVRICRGHPAVGIEEALAENTGGIA